MYQDGRRGRRTKIFVIVAAVLFIEKPDFVVWLVGCGMFGRRRYFRCFLNIYSFQNDPYNAVCEMVLHSLVKFVNQHCCLAFEKCGWVLISRNKSSFWHRFVCWTNLKGFHWFSCRPKTGPFVTLWKRLVDRPPPWQIQKDVWISVFAGLSGHCTSDVQARLMQLKLNFGLVSFD